MYCIYRRAYTYYHTFYIYIYCTYNMLQLLLDVTDYFMLSWWAWKLAIFHLNINMPELNTIYSWCFVTAQVWRIDIRPSRLSISQQLRLHLLNVPLGNESCTSYHPSIEGFKVVGFCCIWSIPQCPGQQCPAYSHQAGRFHTAAGLPWRPSVNWAQLGQKCSRMCRKVSSFPGPMFLTKRQCSSKNTKEKQEINASTHRNLSWELKTPRYSKSVSPEQPLPCCSASTACASSCSEQPPTT